MSNNASRAGLAGDETIMTDDARLYAPSAARNMEPIATVLLPLLPESGHVLEIASGSGEHITRFARAHAGDVVFQPSDPDAAARASIDAWVGELGLTNVRPAVALDASAESWPINDVDVVFCFNMIHISPWAATVGLVQGARRVLRPGGLLVTYGPYQRGGQHTSEGNASFDADLRQRNPAWGIRDLGDVSALAVQAGFKAPEVVEMPANNLSLVFRVG